MFDQLNHIYQIVIRFIADVIRSITDAIRLIPELNLYAYLDVIAGFLAVVLLLLIARRIRKRRKLKKLATTSGRRPDQKHKKKPRRKPKAALDQLPDESAAESAFEATEAIMEPPDEEFNGVLEPSEIEADIHPAPETIAEAEEDAETAVAEPLPEKPAAPVGFLDRLKSGLSKTRQSLSTRFDTILSANRKIDEDVLEEIEEVLITSDIGVPTTMELMQRIGKKADKITTADAFKAALKKEMQSLVDIEYHAAPLEKPHVIMVVGVNGVGKTTTIGKLAAKYAAQGKKVLLSASDTFRAAAVEQLEIWAKRTGADIVKHKDKSDPAAVAFDSVEAAIARDADIVIVDTAGRLHTKVNLMEELKKIKRSIGKKIPSAPHDIFLVLDATTGQNALSQAKLFNAEIDVTGIVLTKLDGTAKGGIVLSICNLLNVPIRYIGIGEGVDDLQEFDPHLFVDALL